MENQNVKKREISWRRPYKSFMKVSKREKTWNLLFAFCFGKFTQQKQHLMKQITFARHLANSSAHWRFVLRTV
jgi:hypothetical protein